MIGLLTGRIAHRSLDHLIIDVGGVGYSLRIPLSTFYALPEDESVRLHVHTHVKEDAIQLYGFLTPEEKAFFLLLVSVTGIGPKLAVNILSNIATADLQAALWEGNLARLAAIPGIGKKTAERLILELRDKVQRHGGSGPVAGRTAPPATPLDDALSALVNLGYKEAQAKKALETMEVSPDAPLQIILKGALKILVK